MHPARWLIVATLAVGCGKRDAEPAAGSGSGSALPASPGQLVALAELRDDVALVPGTYRFALHFAGSVWYESTPGGLAARPEVAAAVTTTMDRIGGSHFELALGASAPIVHGGAEHRERHVRLASPPQDIALDGTLAQVAAFAAGTELWSYEHEARTHVAIVAPDGSVSETAPFERIGPTVESRSSVGATACAAPAVADLAGNGTEVAGLVVECHPEAPIRVATYRLPGPSVTTTRLPPRSALGLDPRQIALSRKGDVVLVGLHDRALVIARVDAAGRVTTTRGPADTGVIAEAVVDAEDHVWVLGVGHRAGDDVWQLSRDGEAVRLVGPGGAPLKPAQLAYDAMLGVVVVGTEAGRHWLLTQRGREAVRTLPDR